MSNRLRHHPEDGQLLRYADGELSARQTADIRSHLEVCWQCRTELQELQTVISECVKYRNDVLEHHLPPPAPWADLYRRFEEIDASVPRRSFIDHVIRILQYPVRHAGRWAPAAAALAIILAIIYQYSFTPAVEAAELLRKASAAAQLTPPKARRLQIRTRTHRFIRPARFDRELSSDTDAQASVAALFVAAHYSWEDPLSAKSYQAWRSQLSDKLDQVTTQPSGYRIETSTRSSELTEATLKLSTPDLIPVEGRFEFRNHESVEITEVTEDAAQPTNEHSRTTAVSAPLPARPPKAGASSTAGDELHILDALHQLGADLGDPIEVKQSEGAILVTGVGIPAERRRQIQDVLGSRPNVILHFSDAPAPRLRPEDTASHETAVTGVEDTGLRARLEAQLGGRTYVEQLTRQILEMSELMMSRAYALRRLAEQMPAGVEAELSNQDRRLLVSLHHDHTAALLRQETEIERVLDPVLTSLGAPDDGAGESPASAGNWQTSTEELFQAARRVDRQLAQMLDVAPEEGQAGKLPAGVRRSLAELRDRAELCDRLTAQVLSLGGR